jgi:microcystin-dependent protein
VSDPFVAEIRIFPFNFAPTGWAFCDGQLLPLSQNTALFSLLGTFYGGDGKTTFALPNLQGSVAMDVGQGNGLSERFLGQMSGTETVTLLLTETPIHNHFLQAQNTPANVNAPGPNTVSLARSSGGGTAYGPVANNVNMAFQALSINGGSLPHNNLQPYVALNYCIAMQGVFPARQ